MALARVVEFEDVSPDRADEMKQRMEGDEPPEGLPAMEFVWFHDGGTGKSLVSQFFDSESGLRRDVIRVEGGSTRLRHALGLSAVYIAVPLIAAYVVFLRRDVAGE